MTSQTPLSFAAFHPGRSISAEDVQRLIGRLSKPDSARPLVFETWASAAGPEHLVGRAKEDTTAVRLMLESHLPGSSTSQAVRPDAPETVLRLTLRGDLPLAEKAEEATLVSLYAALRGLRKGESLGLQIAVGGGRLPAWTQPKINDPTQSMLGALLSGERPASSDLQRRIAAHRSEPRLDVTVRLGVTAGHPERRRELLERLLGALKTLESPGTQLKYVRESRKAWETASLGWAPLTLGAPQLTPLFGWPLEGLSLPGLASIHPLLLPSPAKLPKEGATFADATAPGKSGPVRLSVEARAQHVVITGATGSGKSTVFSHLVLDDIAEGRPALLVDPKHQLVDHILERAPKEAAGRIVVIDAASASPVGVNPLDVGDRDPDVVVDGILAVFKEVFADGWGPRTEDLLHAGLLTLAASGNVRGKPHTLLDLPSLLSSDSYRRSVVGAVKDDPTLSSFWAVFDGLSPAHRASVVAAPLNKLRKYVLRKNVAAVLGQSEPRFRLRDLFKENKVVLVPLNDALLGPGAAQLLGGLIVAEAWLATMERASETNPLERPGAIYIDEVQRYLHLPTSIEDALATSRSYGVAWHVAFQGRSQVPRSFALAIELNARNKLTFAASPTDARELGKSHGDLVAEDFMALAPYELYVDLVSGGAPAGWFSARSLPPQPTRGHEAFIREANDREFGLIVEEKEPNAHETSVQLDLPLTNQRRRQQL